MQKTIPSQETLDRVERALSMRYQLDHDRLSTYDTVVSLFVTLGRIANDLNGNREFTYNTSVRLSSGRYACRLECTGLRERRLERLTIEDDDTKFVRSDDGLHWESTINYQRLQDIIVPLIVELHDDLPKLAHDFAECVEQGVWADMESLVVRGSSEIDRMRKEVSALVSNIVDCINNPGVNAHIIAKTTQGEKWPSVSTQVLNGVEWSITDSRREFEATGKWRFILMCTMNGRSLYINKESHMKLDDVRTVRKSMWALLSLTLKHFPGTIEALRPYFVAADNPS